MKLPNIKILDESNKILRKKSIDVTFPLDKETKQLINDSLDYLEMSQIEEYSEKFDLRPGMGLSFVQIGILKRIFVKIEDCPKWMHSDLKKIREKQMFKIKPQIFIKKLIPFIKK